MQFGILRRRFGRILAIVFAVGVGAFGLYTLSNKVFSIDAIELVGSGITVAVDNNKISKNLLLFPSDKLRTQILKDNPLLADVVFEKHFPRTLRIVPIVRSPFAVLKTPDRIVSIDKSAVVVQEGNAQSTLPVIELPLAGIHVGEQLSDGRLLQSLAFIGGTAAELVVTKITETDGSSLLAKTPQTDIYFSQDKPIGVIIATLQTLMTGFRIKGTLPAVVDLRFDKPVIKF